MGRRSESANLSGRRSYSDEWLIDSGASHHMTGTLSGMTGVRAVAPCLVGLPNGKTVIADRVGSVTLTEKLTLEHVLFVEELQCNLISVSQLIDLLGYFVLFSRKGCLMYDSALHTIGTGEKREGLYMLQGIQKVCSMRKVRQEESVEVWHKRMGHASEKVIRKLPGVDKGSFGVADCDICFRAKQCRSEFPLSSNKSKECFEMIHCDLWGPYRTQSMCGSSYFLTIVDDYSRAVWVFLLVDKTQVEKKIVEFFALIQRQFNKHVKIVRSDNGSEFLKMTDYFRKMGIIHQTSCVGTPQQNGRVERKHRHILNVARALRFEAHLPIEFWGQCVLTAAYLINRTPCELHHGKSPYEIIFGEAPKYGEIRIFGCLAYAHNQKRDGDKFASRSRKCVFLGYPYAKKGWTLFDLDTRELFVSRDVTFVEGKFPFSEAEDGSGFRKAVEDVVVVADRVVDTEEDRWIQKYSGPVRDVVHVPETVTDAVHVPGSMSDGLRQSVGEPAAVADVRQQETVTEEVTESEAVAQAEPVAVDAELGRGMRKREPSVKLRDYVLNTVYHMQPSTVSQESNQEYGVENFVNCDRFSEGHRAFLASITAGVIPKSFAEAMKCPRWREAMRLEIEAQERNGTWSIESLPSGKRMIECKWVYTIKYNADGTIERYKARLVACGNRQKEGVDYTETFAPVAKMSTVRLVLQVAAGKNWELHQMDVHNAFLHGDLEEEVFMRIPQGFGSSQKGKVCRLHKSLYGLKQAPRCWFAKLSAALHGYGFKQCRTDYSLFSLVTSQVQLHVLVYVDDLVVTGNSPSAIQKFKTYLSGCFHMKDLGKLKYFLGIEVARSAEGIYLSQRKYVLDIITDVGLLGGRPVEFPIEPNHQLGRSKEKVLTDPEKYRRLVGRLIYLSATRPDIAYSVHILSQFMHEPREDHWSAALRVVRYLKGCPGLGILLKADCDFHLTGWCDSDWAGCPITRRSLNGWLIQLGSSPVSWKSKKQDVVSLSSAEAEYRAMVAALKELKWIKGVLGFMGIVHSGAMDLYCDSKSALHIAANPVFHERTKHVESDCHFIRDEIQAGVLQTKHVSTTEQLADVFTKALGGRPFQAILPKLGIRDLHAPT